MKTLPVLPGQAAGISLCDAVNFLVEKYALVLPTSRDSAPVPALS